MMNIYQKVSLVIFFCFANYLSATNLQEATERFHVVGVITSSNPLNNMATIRDLQEKKTFTVKSGGVLHQDAPFSLARIERKKVLISDGETTQRLVYGGALIGKSYDEKEAENGAVARVDLSDNIPVITVVDEYGDSQNPEGYTDEWIDESVLNELKDLIKELNTGNFIDIQEQERIVDGEGYDEQFHEEQGLNNFEEERNEAYEEQFFYEEDEFHGGYDEDGNEDDEYYEYEEEQREDEYDGYDKEEVEEQRDDLYYEHEDEDGYDEW